MEIGRKKVLEIITLANSAEAFIGDQFSFFQQTGKYEMHLICSPDDTIEDFVKRQGIHYMSVEICREFSICKDIKAVIQISRYIRKNHIDIIIAHYFPKASMIANFANLLAGNKTKIMVAHGVLHDTMHGLLRQAVIWEQKFDVLFAKKVICVSQSVARRRREDGIEKEEKQIILGSGSCNGVDTINKFNPDNFSQEEIDKLRKKYSISGNDFVVGFSGRLVRDKGVVELQQAYQQLKNKLRIPVKLLIIGEAESRDAIPFNVLNSLRDDNMVIFTGEVPYSDIQKYYLLMNVLVLPSYREGFPTVVLEAGAMGIPVVTTKSTGCVDSIIENKTGLFADINPVSLCNQIQLFTNKSLANEMGHNARRHIQQNYDHKVVREYMLRVLDEIS